MIYYKSYRNIDRKLKWVIVDDIGMITNRSPTKDELEDLEIEKHVNRKKIYTDEELLNELRRFDKEEGRVPTRNDFVNNPGYPSSWTYQRRFGDWSNALKLVELGNESMIKKGILETSNQKARLAELIVLNHFKTHPVDLAGENRNSPCDGICPNGKTYEVKGSGLCFSGTYWVFKTDNKHKKNIDIYYFLAFDLDWTKLMYAWRVPEKIKRSMFYIGLNSNYKFNIENMKKYDITEKFRDIMKEIDMYKSQKDMIQRKMQQEVIIEY